MVALDTVLQKFDASKAAVKQEIRDGFFNPDGTMRIGEGELRAWIADRAVDELKVVLQLSHVVSKCAHRMPGSILAQVTEQTSDEARHFEILRALVPAELQSDIAAKVEALPSVLDADPHWTALKASVEAGNPFAALLDINIVHEGYSAAAIEELKDIPFDDIREAYAGIGADEEKHHESGRDLLLWLIQASQGQAGADGDVAQVVGGAHERAAGGALSWSWPAASSTDVIDNAHERAVPGGALSWSWPSSASQPDT